MPHLLRLDQKLVDELDVLIHVMTFVTQCLLHSVQSCIFFSLNPSLLTNNNVSCVPQFDIYYGCRLYHELTIELLLNHLDFVVAAVSVNVFQQYVMLFPPLVSIIFCYTTANVQEPTNGCCVHAEVLRCICSL
jgi:hypothetical protein